MSSAGGASLRSPERTNARRNHRLIPVVERSTLPNGAIKALGNAGDARQVLILSGKGWSVSKSRASWMREGEFGVMVHWVAPGPPPQHGEHMRDLNAAADRFDIGRFLKDFRRTKADWLIFTIGQRTGFASPNKVMDSLAGPGHCTRRDLVLEIATEVKKSGSRFIAYIPCRQPARCDQEGICVAIEARHRTGGVPAAIR